MRNIVVSLLSGAVLLAVSGGRSSGTIPEDPFKLTTGDYNADPLTGKKYSMTLKVSTLQVLFSEAPFTVEVFGRKGFSSQFTVSIIFPLKEESFLEDFFESSGKDASASARGLISYRNSPYNTHGMSFRYELRKYGRKFYYAPQLLYKYNYFDEYSFRILQADRAYWQTESKRSNIFGLGLMAGRQTYSLKHVTDWYAGIGIRARKMNYTIHQVKDTQYPDNIEYPEFSGSKFSFYPFINFGFRTGLVL